VHGGERGLNDHEQFFEEKVRPLFEEKCFECHSHQAGRIKGGLTLDSRSGWLSGGDSGPAIVPGDPDSSLLIRAVRRTDPDLQMPPKNVLSAEEISSLEEWVRRGAVDPRRLPARVESAADLLDTDWWSLAPLILPNVPPDASHPIDAFIVARLREAGISPAPEADRRTLIRRLFFDLHGLPPTPEDVDSFIADPHPAAFERLIDRLLASPRYGERWARHWLDGIHFADTHGFEHDLMRTNAWPYRDYVIESLNRDTPWPRFIREQLAADVIFPDEPWLTAALGFIAAGPWDQSTAQTAPRNFEYLDRDDMVTQTLSVFASTTVHCARCHDHKFDPIPQEDYYALQAVFAGVGRGDLTYDSDLALTRERARWERLRQAAQTADRALLLAAEVANVADLWESTLPPEAVWESLRPILFLTSGPAKLRLLEDHSLKAEGPRPDTDTYTLLATPSPGFITALRLEVLTDSTLPKNGPGRQDNGNFHLSELELRLVQPSGTQSDPVAITTATADFNQAGWTIEHAVDGQFNTAWGIHPNVGESHTAVFFLAQPLALDAGAQLALQLKQLHGQGHLIGRFRIAVTRDPPAHITILPPSVAEALRLQKHQRNDEHRLALAAHAARLKAEAHLATLPPPKRVFAAGPLFTAVAEGGFYKPWNEPKTIHVLHRGDIERPGAAAEPGALSAITALRARFELPDPANEGARRAALADWLADPRNPLTWRSLVNRVWHHHFGRGLSDSLNDFGRMGTQPSHPELLDWLACTFRDSGGSLKSLHRLILTSAAYRRTSRHDPAAAALDPENRLLWRRHGLRLDAESYRDSVLAVAGCLDLTMGGPGVLQFKLGKPIQLTPTVDYSQYHWNSPGAGRRSIYRFVYRGIPDPFMDALDFPDASQLAPTRPFSASPLQALALWNHDFVLHHCERFAARLEHHSDLPSEQIRYAFRRALQREPTERELADLLSHVADAGLPAMCRLLFNANEFLFVN
jgi:hypothetical protein